MKRFCGFVIEMFLNVATHVLHALKIKTAIDLTFFINMMQYKKNFVM